MRFKLQCCAFFTFAAVVAPSSAASYQFVNIADSAGPFAGVFGRAINNSGMVAFSATLDAGGKGIFVGSGGAITTLYDSSGPFSEFGLRDINDSGTVVFWATLDAGGYGGFTGNGGPTTTITSGPDFGWARINNQGAVAFSTSQALYVGSGGPLTTIADTSGPFHGNFIVGGINDSGTVGFFAHRVDGQGIFTGSGGAITTVFLPDGGSAINYMQINNDGTVAFEIWDFANVVDAIFVGSPGSITTFADSSGPFAAFDPFIGGLNNNGQVAFYGYPDAGGEGIFAGPDPLADKVIQIGDLLFGSNVTYLGKQPGLNDTGEVLFNYNLANGINGTAVARPDQPLTGDYNLNGTVDAADYVVWRKNTSQSYEAWRTLFGQSALSTPVDFNNDGTVDAADYVIWRKTGDIQYNAWRTHFGAPSGAGTGAAGASPSQAAVPEPATLALLMFAAAGWWVRRHRAA